MPERPQGLPVPDMASSEIDLADLYEQHSRELLVHCYRMLGSFAEAEDLMQETFARAIKSLTTFEGRSTPRAWLYRIATNACLDQLRKRKRRRVLPFDVMAPFTGTEPPPEGDWLWVEPFPDRLLTSDEPVTNAIQREALELVFIAAIQHLTPRQRVVLIARDYLDWSTEETAELLETSGAAVKSALQRARTTLASHLPADREEWTAPTDVTDKERQVLERYIEAMAGDDLDAMAALLREDVRVAYPQIPIWSESRDTFIEISAEEAPPGEYRFVATSANFQPAVAIYLKTPDDDRFRIVALEVLTVRDGKITEIVDYDLPDLYPSFGLEPAISG